MVSLLRNTNCLCHLKPSRSIFCGLIFRGFVSASLTITKLSVKLVSLLLALNAPSESPGLLVDSLRTQNVHRTTSLMNVYLKQERRLSTAIKFRRLSRGYRFFSIKFNRVNRLTWSACPRCRRVRRLRSSGTSGFHDFSCAALPKTHDYSEARVCCWNHYSIRYPSTLPSPRGAWRLPSRFPPRRDCSRIHSS